MNFRENFSSSQVYGRLSSVIDTNEKLAGFLPVLTAADWIALDTEADSLHAYPEKVCTVIQT